MNVKNIFDLWANDPYVPSLCLEVLSDEDTRYWAAHNRWPLLSAIYLSMGFNPLAKQKQSGKLLEIQFPDEKQVSEFFRRIKSAHAACENKSLFDDIVAVTNNGFGGPAVDREVDSKIFIDWARENFESNCETLYEMALKSHKSTAHSKSGSSKGKQADEVKKQITEKAIKELEEGCLCHNPDLARFLCEQNIKDIKKKNSDEKFVLVLPGIDDLCYEPHFLEATNAAFNEMGIPLRNKPKTPGAPKRGKGCCNRPGHKS